MISRSNNFEAFAELVDHLDEATEHLRELVQSMSNDPNYAEEEFAVDMGHVYAHLNRVWNCRNSKKGMCSENWEKISKFPTDIRPVG